jgi:hypothetical protein
VVLARSVMTLLVIEIVSVVRLCRAVNDVCVYCVFSAAVSNSLCLLLSALCANGRVAVVAPARLSAQQCAARFVVSNIAPERAVSRTADLQLHQAAVAGLPVRGDLAEGDVLRAR